MVPDETGVEIDLGRPCAEASLIQADFVQNYSDFSNSVRGDEQMEEAFRLISEYDYLGRSWYRMFRELELMKEQNEAVLPPAAERGFCYATYAMAGAWFVQKDSMRKEPQVTLDSETKEKIAQVVKPYRHLLEAVAEKIRYGHYRQAMMVGVLKRQFETVVDQELPETREEFKIGLNLAMKKWRMLTTND